jgi:hypothetical protein
VLYRGMEEYKCWVELNITNLQYMIYDWDEIERHEPWRNRRVASLFMMHLFCSA